MSESLEQLEKLMGALVRMKPKPHEEMKVGKQRNKRKTSRKSVRLNENFSSIYEASDFVFSGHLSEGEVYVCCPL
jgi:hypothetical protein